MPETEEVRKRMEKTPFGEGALTLEAIKEFVEIFPDKEKVGEFVKRITKGNKEKAGRLFKFFSGEFTSKELTELMKQKKEWELKEYLKKLPGEYMEKADELVSKKGFGRREAIIGTIIAAAAAGYTFSKFIEEKPQKTVEKGKEIKDLSDIGVIEKLAEYPKMIEGAKKQTPDEFVKELSGKNFGCLILGDRDLPSPGYEEAAEIVDKLSKSGKKPSVIALEGLLYTNPHASEATDRFNNGQGSIEEMKQYVVGTKWHLLELAKKHHVKIAGLEKGERDRRGKVTTSFPEITERAKAIAEENKKDGPVIISVRQEVATTDGWENDKLLSKLNRGQIPLYGEAIPGLPSKEEALKSNYTIKESLEKAGITSVVVQIENWGLVTDSFNVGVHKAYDDTYKGNLKAGKAIINSAKKSWKSFILKEKKAPFIVQYPGAGERTRALVLPYDVPEELPFAKERGL